MKTASLLILSCALLFSSPAEAGSVQVENKTSKQLKVSSVGGRAYVDAHSVKTVSFDNDEEEVTIALWWVENARQLCQVFTPWDRTIIVTGKSTIQCLSKK